jgi:hypothetical protein
MHEPVGPAWLVWLETSAIAAAMRQQLWLYPIVEIIHILGFIVLVGSAAMFDVRLLGWSRQLSVGAMARHLLPWARWALLVVAPSGALLFSAHATEMAANSAFRVKIALIIMAGLNAALFHRGAFKSVQAWDHDVAAPTSAKLAALLSLVLWAGVLTCGRLLAYL